MLGLLLVAFGAVHESRDHHGPKHFEHHVPAKLYAAQRKMELEEKNAAQEMDKDDTQLEDLDNKLDSDKDREERKEAKMEEKFEKRLGDSESAFESALKKSEKTSAEEGEETMKDFEAKIERRTEFPGHSSFLQTGDKAKASTEATAAAAAEAKAMKEIESEAKEAANTKLGSKMRDMLQTMADERYTDKKKMDSDRAEEHNKLDEIRKGLKQEELRLKTYAATEDHRRDQLTNKIKTNDAAFQKHLADGEAKFEAHNKATEASMHTNFEKSHSRYQANEKKAVEIMEDAFNDPTEGSNLRSGA